MAEREALTGSAVKRLSDIRWLFQLLQTFLNHMQYFRKYYSISLVSAMRY